VRLRAQYASVVPASFRHLKFVQVFIFRNYLASNLLLRSRMSGGMPPFLQYAFMADIGTTVTIYQLFTERSNYKKRSLSRRSRRSSACPQIPFILCKPKVHYPAYNSTSLVPILRRMSPFHTLSSCFLRSILILSSYLFFFVALRPNAGHGLLILEVSRSHSTTHHSR